MWLSQQMDNIKGQNLNEEEKFNLKNTAYKIVMKEIIKQVYIECKERGWLLESIWNQAMELKLTEQTKSSKFY